MELAKSNSYEVKLTKIRHQVDGEFELGGEFGVDGEFGVEGLV